MPLHLVCCWCPNKWLKLVRVASFPVWMSFGVQNYKFPTCCFATSPDITAVWDSRLSGQWHLNCYRKIYVWCWCLTVAMLDELALWQIIMARHCLKPVSSLRLALTRCIMLAVGGITVFCRQESADRYKFVIESVVSSQWRAYAKGLFRKSERPVNVSRV